MSRQRPEHDPGFRAITSSDAGAADDAGRAAVPGESPAISPDVLVRLFLDQAQDGIVVLDQHGAVQAANRCFADMLGYSLDEVRRLSVWDWEDQVSKSELLELLARPGEFGDLFETRHRRKDGTTLEVEIAITRVAVSGQRFDLCVCRDITRRRMMERSLRESEAAFHKIFEESSNPIMLMRGERFINCNRATLSFLGLADKSELLGRTPMDISPVHQPDGGLSAESAAKHIARALHDGLCRFEWTVLRTDGRPLLLEVALMPMTLNGEELLHVTWLDVTERRRAEEALRRQTVMFQNLFRGSLDAIAMLDGEDRIVEVNEAFLTLFGYSREEVGGKPINSLVAHGQVPTDAEEFSRSVFRTGRAMERQTLRCKRDGTPVDVTVIGYPIVYEGRIIGAYGIYRDITEQKMAETALRKSEERFAKAFNSSPAPLVISETTTGRFIAVNDRWVTMLGHAREEQIGRTSKEVGIWVDPTQRDRAIEKLLGDGALREFPIDFRTKSGHIRSALWSAELITMGDREVMLSLIFDYTERKIAEEALFRSLKEKETLLKEIHHRVKNNLQIMVSLISLQTMDLADDGAVEMFNSLRDRVHTMALIHEQLYSSGNLSEVDMPRYLRLLTRNIESVFRTPGRQVDLRIEAEDILLGIDQAIPCGLLLNELISNAYKHAFQGAGVGSLHVRLRMTGHIVELDVQDDGRGLPPDYEARDSLGMKLVRTLVDQLRGSLEIFSEQGSRFCISFPRDAGEA